MGCGCQETTPQTAYVPVLTALKQTAECVRPLFCVCLSACSHSDLKKSARVCFVICTLSSPLRVYLYVAVGGGAWPSGLSSEGEALPSPSILSSRCPLKPNESPSIIGPTEWFLCERIKPHPLCFLCSFLLPPTYVTFVSPSILVFTHNSSLLSSCRDVVE